MATILDFQHKSVKAMRPKIAGESGQVLFFTGVRYERAIPPDPRRSDPAPRRKPEAVQPRPI